MKPQTACANNLVMADSVGRDDDLKKTEHTNLCGINNGKEMSAISKSASQAVADLTAKSLYCEKLQKWMWQYYCGYVSWQSWSTMFPFPPCFPSQSASGSLRAPAWGADVSNPDLRTWISHSPGVSFSPFPSVPVHTASTAANNASERQVQVNGQSLNVPIPQHVQQNGNAQQPGTAANCSAIKVSNILQLNVILDQIIVLCLYYQSPKSQDNTASVT